MSGKELERVNPLEREDLLRERAIKTFKKSPHLDSRAEHYLGDVPKPTRWFTIRELLDIRSRLEPDVPEVIRCGNKSLKNWTIRGASPIWNPKVFTMVFHKDGLYKGKETEHCLVITNREFKTIYKAVNCYLYVPNPHLTFIRLMQILYADIPPCPIRHGKTPPRLGSWNSFGGQGFGFARTEEGKLLRFPHIGGIIIGEGVEIGSNVCIDRGALGDTVIGVGTKIDNHVHIAHNVIVGKHCHIVAHTTIGGSTEIGDYCWIGMGAQIRNKVKIGTNVTIGMGAIVVSDVKDNAIVAGNPAKVIGKNVTWSDGRKQSVS